MSAPRRLTILGATGSVGESTLDVVARHPGRFVIHALTAHRDVEGLARACAATDAEHAVIADAARADDLRDALAGHGARATVSAGPEALADVARDDGTELVMAAIVGAAGLAPTLAAARAGKRILLANKEALVVAGALFMDTAQRHGAEIIPVDSEHNALFQSLPREFEDDLAAVGVQRLVLTASGGPFLERPTDTLDAVTPDEACAHPNWDMGRKISVDSATLMNKGLEVIEARWLFNASRDQIGVVVHPQSLVHAMVEMRDGSVLAELGAPDMRTPIAHALAWPDRVDAGVARLDLVAAGRLDFLAPDFERFPCLKLAFDALDAGGSAPLILNAANEVAVEAFLGGRIRFTDIATVVGETLSGGTERAERSLEALTAQDQAARRTAREAVLKREQVRV